MHLLVYLYSPTKMHGETHIEKIKRCNAGGFVGLFFKNAELYFVFCFVRVWNMVSCIEVGTSAEGVGGVVVQKIFGPEGKR